MAKLIFIFLSKNYTKTGLTMELLRTPDKKEGKYGLNLMSNIGYTQAVSMGGRRLIIHLERPKNGIDK